MVIDAATLHKTTNLDIGGSMKQYNIFLILQKIEPCKGSRVFHFGSLHDANFKKFQNFKILNFKIYNHFL